MRLFSLLLFLSLTGFTFSQNETGGKRRCRTIFFQAPAGAPEKLQMFDGTNSQEISLPRRNLSKVYSLPPGPLTLWFLPEPVIATAPINLAAPKVVIPEGLTDFYLLVSSDLKNPVLPLKVQVVDASSSQFRNGQMMWFNLTDHEVGGLIGSKRLAMKGRSKVVIDSPADQQADYGVELLFKISTEEKPRPMTNTIWSYNPEAKWIVFIYNEEGRRAPRVAGFADFRDSTE